MGTAMFCLIYYILASLAAPPPWVSSLSSQILHFSSILAERMDSHPSYISTGPDNLVAINTTFGVALTKNQPLTHTFSPLAEKLKSSSESESPYLSTVRLRSTSTVTSGSSSSPSSSSNSSSVSDEEVLQQYHAAALYANVDQAFSCIQRAYLNVQRAHRGKKVMQTTTNIFRSTLKKFYIIDCTSPNPKPISPSRTEMAPSTRD